jgi:hypothetical protein
MYNLLIIKIRMKETVVAKGHDYQVKLVVLGKPKPMK